LIAQLLISRPPRGELFYEQPLIVMLYPVCIALVFSIAVCHVENVSEEGKVCLPDNVGDREAISKCQALFGTFLHDIKFALLIQYFDLLAYFKWSTARKYGCCVSVVSSFV
jgi:hypothetical protein